MVIMDSAGKELYRCSCACKFRQVAISDFQSLKEFIGFVELFGIDKFEQMVQFLLGRNITV